MYLERRIHRENNGRRIEGAAIRVFIHNQAYFLTDLSVYADGMVDCWELVTFERFKFKVESGWVVSTLPEGAKVGVSGLCNLVATKVSSFMPESELIKEVADIIEVLNGRPDSSAKCHEALRAYHQTPTEPAKAALRAAYEAVPAHLRRFLGDQDRKDFPIRMIIYGPEEVEGWSHRAASKALGIPAPTLDPKAYLDEVFATPEQQLNTALDMALQYLYRGNGLTPVFFPAARHDEVEKLFREGKLDEGLRAASADLETLLHRAVRRPQLMITAASVHGALAEYLFGLDRTEEALVFGLRSIELNPDGHSDIAVAKAAVKVQSKAIAQRLEAVRREFELPPLSASLMTNALGLDVKAYERLLV